MMHIEFEAKFFIDHEKARKKIQDCGGKLVRVRGLMRRFNFEVPGDEIRWLRVRDEGIYTTLTLKSLDPDKGIACLQELEVQVSDFDTTVQMIQLLGFKQMIYAENYREIWSLGDCLIMLDLWPGLDPFIEIEGKFEQFVWDITNWLGLSKDQALYGTCKKLYIKKYQISDEEFEKSSKITFAEMPDWMR